MGNLNSPGIYKFFFPKQFVQNKNSSIHSISLMNLDKNIVQIAEYPDKQKNLQFKTIFVHFQNYNTDKIKELKNIPNSKLILIPDQNCKLSFQQLKKIQEQNSLKILGKMIINGDKMHPLIKYLKKNQYNLYDYDMLGSSSLKSSFGVFIYQNNGKTYYFQDKKWESLKETFIK